MPPPIKPQPPKRIDPPDLEDILLDGNGDASLVWEEFFGNIILRNVKRARLFTFRPAPDVANGRAVIVLPGGGFQFLSMRNEGFAVAEDLAKQGYHAFVLAYTTCTTATEPEEFLIEAGRVFSQLGKKPIPIHEPASGDLVAAIGYIHENAAAFGLKQPEPSILGFSAGARCILNQLRADPDLLEVSSIALMYPAVGDPIERFVSADYFIAIAADDPLLDANLFGLITDLRAADQSVEFHLFKDGDHGFSRSCTGKTADGWFAQYSLWLASA